MALEVGELRPGPFRGQFGYLISDELQRNSLQLPRGSLPRQERVERGPLASRGGDGQVIREEVDLCSWRTEGTARSTGGTGLRLRLLHLPAQQNTSGEVTAGSKTQTKEKKFGGQETRVEKDLRKRGINMKHNSLHKPRPIPYSHRNLFLS